MVSAFRTPELELVRQCGVLDWCYVHSKYCAEVALVDRRI
jgi:hypothetical protein